MMFLVLSRGIFIILCNPLYDFARESREFLMADAKWLGHLVDRWVDGYIISDDDYKERVKSRNG